MLITRRAEFSASHICRLASLSPEQNRELYGAGANASGHGHNYVLEVTLEGDPDPATGMIFDLKKLKEIIQQSVVEPMDHRFLNYEVPPFNKVVPTAENVAVEIWDRLEPWFKNEPVRLTPVRLSPVRLSNVRLYETEDLYVDYAGSGREEATECK